MKKLIELSNVSKTFKEKNVLNNIDLKIKENDSICFIGKNGAGKTTLLKLIAQLHKPDKNGYINFDKTVYDEQKINFLFQENEFYVNLKVNKILKYIRKKQKNENYFNYLYKELELENIADNSLFNLSGGEKQKLIIFQIILSQPKILILDEYSNNIDFPTAKKLKKIISDYCKKNNVTILMSSHKRYEIADLFKEIIFLKGGSIFKKFKKESPFTKEEVENIMNILELEDAK